MSLEGLAICATAFLFEVAEDASVDRSEFLQRFRPPEPLHRSLPSSERQVADLGSIVELSADFTTDMVAEFLHRCGTGFEAVCDGLLGVAMTLHGLLQEG